MHYKSVMVAQNGRPEVLQVIENELRPPGSGEACIRVLAAAVSRPDISVRQGKALYSGTPLGQKLPFVPGYAVVGEVEAVGRGVRQVQPGQRVGALTVVGGYSEYLYWKSSRLIPVPAGLDPGEAVTLVLNYLVAYQVLHRVARVKAGEKALIIGASGGIGTALLQLGRLAGLVLYGLASPPKHAAVQRQGAMALDYHGGDYVENLRRLEPRGLDAIFDGMMNLQTVQAGLSLLHSGGRMVSYGEPASFAVLRRILWTMAALKLQPGRKSLKLYGTSTYFLGKRKPYQEDWATLFKLLEEGKINPLIAARFPILEAARANELMESGQAVGNIVLVAPEYLAGAT